MAQHDHGMATRLHIVLETEQSSQHGPDPAHREVGARHHFAGDCVNPVAGVPLQEREADRRDLREDFARVRLDVAIVRVGERPVRIARLLVENVEQLVGPLERRFAKQCGVDQREDRGIRADPHCQREHGNQRECRTAAQPAQAEAQVLDQRVHEALLSRANLISP